MQACRHENSRRHGRHACGTILAKSEEPNLYKWLKLTICLKYYNTSRDFPNLLDIFIKICPFFGKTKVKRYSFVRNPKFLPILPEEPKGTILMSGNYRVSHNTVSTFVFWISRLPRGLEIPFWTFFNSPFCADFKNIQFCIIRWNIDWDIGKIQQGGDFRS